MWTNTKTDLITGILNHGTDVLKHAVVDYSDEYINEYIERIKNEKLDYPFPLDIKQISKQRKWMIPSEHFNLNIEEFLTQICPKENHDRLIKELNLYKSHNMLDVLYAMKYIVDTLRKNKIVWGVGRGSSVASYVLFLLGVHKIDSVKYNLPIEEFFKVE